MPPMSFKRRVLSALGNDELLEMLPFGGATKTGVAMNKQQGMAIIEGLRRARAAGGPVVELTGADARNFTFVRDDSVRKVLLGSFGVEAGKKFFATVVSAPRSDDAFQFFVFEKLKGNPVLATSSASEDGIVWTYQATKQHGDNHARKRAFLEAAKAESLTTPLPREDISEFSAAINRAIELRRLADAAEGGDNEEQDTAVRSARVLYPGNTACEFLALEPDAIATDVVGAIPLIPGTTAEHLLAALTQILPMNWVRERGPSATPAVVECS